MKRLTTDTPDGSQWEYCVECHPEHKGCQTCVYAARREELEPCKSCVKEYQIADGEDLPGHVLNNFCPYCGRPLTGKAWGELERRIGGSNGTADTLF